jgi:hypothetical protein
MVEAHRARLDDQVVIRRATYTAISDEPRAPLLAFYRHQQRLLAATLYRIVFSHGNSILVTAPATGKALRAGIDPHLQMP